jgi:predicted RNase H-like nuclease (RuvC/YqgF family)
VKGKHANAADRRRHIEALERRAETAERQVAERTSELAALREKSELQITGLRRELAALRKQRDENASPHLDAAEQRIRSLMDEMKRADQRVEEIMRKDRARADGMFTLLMLIGFTRVEGLEILASTHGNDSVQVAGVNTGVDMRAAKKLSPEAIARIQRAKGNRSNPELVKELRAALADASNREAE